MSENTLRAYVMKGEIAGLLARNRMKEDREWGRRRQKDRIVKQASGREPVTKEKGEGAEVLTIATRGAIGETQFGTKTGEGGLASK